MMTVKCDMCGKIIAEGDKQTNYSISHETGFSCYDICEECSNKVEGFIKAAHKYFCEPINPEEQEAIDKWKEGLSETAMFKKEENKCNKEHCEGCESFDYTSSPIHPNKLHIRCNKTNQFGVVELEHTVKPEDFYEGD